METRIHDPRIRERGFTLLEVIMAICVLTVGILAVASMQGSSSRNNILADSRTEAVTWAEDQMESLLSLAWDNPLLSDTDGDGATGLADQGFDNDTSTKGDADHQVVQGKYSIYWNVADNAIIGNTKTVNIIVTWKDYGRQGSVSMQRVIPRIV